MLKTICQKMKVSNSQTGTLEWVCQFYYHAELPHGKILVR